MARELYEWEIKKLEIYEPIMKLLSSRAVTKQGLENFKKNADIKRGTRKKLYERASYVLETVEEQPGILTKLKGVKPEELYGDCKDELVLMFRTFNRDEAVLKAFLKYAVKEDVEIEDGEIVVRKVIIDREGRRRLLKITLGTLVAIGVVYGASQLMFFFKKGEKEIPEKKPIPEADLKKYAEDLIGDVAIYAMCHIPEEEYYPEIVVENLTEMTKKEAGHPAWYKGFEDPVGWPKIKNRGDDTQPIKDYVDEHPESIKVGTLGLDDELRIVPEFYYKNIIVHELAHYLFDFHCRKMGVYPPFISVPGTFCKDVIGMVSAEFHANAVTYLYCSYILASDPALGKPGRNYELADSLIKELVGNYGPQGLYTILGYLNGYSKVVWENLDNPRALLEKFRYDVSVKDPDECYNSLKNYIYDEAVPFLEEWGELEEGSYDDSIFLSEVHPDIAEKLKEGIEEGRRGTHEPTGIVTTFATGGALAALFYYTFMKSREGDITRREFLFGGRKI